MFVCHESRCNNQMDIALYVSTSMWLCSLHWYSSWCWIEQPLIFSVGHLYRQAKLLTERLRNISYYATFIWNSKIHNAVSYRYLNKVGSCGSGAVWGGWRETVPLRHMKPLPHRFSTAGTYSVCAMTITTILRKQLENLLYFITGRVWMHNRQVCHRRL